jgi:hypothetical protein
MHSDLKHAMTQKAYPAAQDSNVDASSDVTLQVARIQSQASRALPASGLVNLCLLSMLASPLVLAQASPNAAGAPQNTSAPTDIEGLWLPDRGGPPGAGPAGPPPGPPAVVLVGTQLQCAPIQRLNGSGGGMVTLIIQGPRQIVMISEEDMDIARKIYLNSKHPRQLTPQPNGHSIGHWEGDTLVVDTIGYADTSGKDKGQHIVERISKQANKLVDIATITDAGGAVRTQNLSWAWRPDLQINENVCEEGFDRYQVINGSLDNPNIPPSREGQK